MSVEKIVRLDSMFQRKYKRGIASIIESPDAVATEPQTGRRYLFVAGQDGKAGALVLAPDGDVLAALPANEVIADLMKSAPHVAIQVSRTLTGGFAPAYKGRASHDVELVSQADLQYWMAPDGTVWTMHRCRSGEVAVFEGAREVERFSKDQDPFDTGIPEDVAYLTETILRRSAA